MNEEKEVRANFPNLGYPKLVVKYEGTLSDVILSAIEEWDNLYPNKPPKDLLIMYLSASKIYDLKKGIAIRYKMGGDRNTQFVPRVYVGKIYRDWPILSLSDGVLWRRVCDEWSLVGKYEVETPPDTLRYQARTILGKILKKKIKVNTPITASTLRRLRIYSLIHDFDKSPLQVASVLRLKEVKYWFDSPAIRKEQRHKFGKESPINKNDLV